MSELVLVVLWAVYPLWLAAGWLDYRHHSRRAASRTGGVREATLHLAMLCLVAMGLGATLAWLPSYTVLLALASMALGYLALATSMPRWVEVGSCAGPVTRTASRLFEGLPLVGMALYVAEQMPRLDLLAASGWDLTLREPPLHAGVWIAVFLPVIAFVIGPGLAELRRAWLARPAQPA